MDLNNKSVLITGGAGFIGSHLVEKLLLSTNCDLNVLIKYNSNNNRGWLDGLDLDKKKNIKFFSGDIRDPYFIKNITKNIDVVFHLAALIGIPYSYDSPESYVETNIKGTLNVLQAAKENSVSKVLLTSTSEVYGTAKYTPIDENHPKQGQSPYSATKISSDFIAQSFYNSFDTPISIVRPFNTFGPRQSNRAIIPTIITQILSGNKIIKLGNLKSTRDFLYVNDTVDGFIEIAKSDRTIGEEINISTGIEISMYDLANMIIKKMNTDVKIDIDSIRLRPEKSEVDQLLGCNKKISTITNWKQNFTFEEGLEKTIEWLSKNKHLYKQEIYNV